MTVFVAGQVLVVMEHTCGYQQRVMGDREPKAGKEWGWYSEAVRGIAVNARCKQFPAGHAVEWWLAIKRCKKRRGQWTRTMGDWG